MADFQTSIELKAVTRDLNQKLDKVKKQLQGVSTQARKTQGSFKKMSSGIKRSMKGIGNAIEKNRTALLAMGAAVAGIVGKGIKDFKEFEDGMAQIGTLGVTGLKQVEKQLDQVRKQFGITGAEATKGYYDIISAGASQGAQALGQLTAATKLAKAGNTDLAKAIDVVTSGINIFGESGETATTITDKLFLAVKFGKTTVAELGKTFGFVAPVIAAAGLGMSDYAAAMATVTAGGIQTNQATTGLKAVLSNLIKVTPKAKKAAEDLGIEFGVAALKSKGFVAVLQDIKDKTGGDVTKLGQLFDSIEAINAVAVLTSNTGLKNLKRNFDAMSDSAGTVAGAMEVVKKSFSFNIGKFNQSLSIMSKSIGASVIPSLLGMAETMEPVVEFFTALITQHPGIIKVTVGVAALGVALALLGGPVTIAIVAVGAAFAALLKHFDAFEEGGTAALEKMNLSWDNFVAGFNADPLGAIVDVFKDLGNAIFDALPGSGDTIDFADYITITSGEMWAKVKGGFTELWTSIMDFFTTTDWNGIATSIGEGIRSIFEFQSDILKSVSESISELFDFSGEGFSVDWDGIFEGLRTVVEGYANFISTIWLSAFGIKPEDLDFSNATKALSDAFKDIDWAGILSGIKDALIGAFDSVTTFLTAIDFSSLGENIGIAIGNGIQVLGTLLKDVLIGGIGLIGDAFTLMFTSDGATSVMGSLWTAFKSVFSGITDFLMGLLSGLFQGVFTGVDFTGLASDFGGAMLDGFMSVIGQIGSALVGIVSDALSSLSSFIPSWLGGSGGDGDSAPEAAPVNQSTTGRSARLRKKADGGYINGYAAGGKC